MKNWLIATLGMLSFIGMMGTFMYWAPWMGSRPIAEIAAHDLSNLPPPADARAFAMNHGKAIYFTHGTASEEPLTFAALTAVLLGQWGVVVWAFFRLKPWQRWVTRS